MKGSLIMNLINFDCWENGMPFADLNQAVEPVPVEAIIPEDF